ncbi:MAG: hypothetical protein R3B91_23085 [Planctomycetaceae bacterium]
MSIKFRCTCGKAYKVSEANAGRKMVCKGCKKTLRVPEAAPVPAVTKSASRKTAAPKSEEFEFDDDSARDTRPVAAAPPPLVNVKRKRRRSEESDQRRDPSKSRKTLILVALVLFGLIGGGGVGYVVMSAATATKAPPEPQKYVQYKSQEGHFSADAPDGWKTDGAGGTGGVPPWARFEDGTATISIKGNLAGSAVSDMFGASQNPGGLDEEIPEELTPIGKMHEFQKERIAVDYSDYEEQPGKNVKIPWGEVRISEFTASEGFGSSIRGYRMTMTSVQWQINVVAKCPKRKWEEYQPIFDHVLHSIDNGY